MKFFLSSALFAVFLIAGCGGGDDSSAATVADTAGSTTTSTGTTTDSGGSGTTGTTTKTTGSWGTPAVVSKSDNTQAASSLYLSSAAAKEAFAVWLQKDSKRQRLMAAQFVSGSWTAAAALDVDPGLADAATPCGTEEGGEPCVPSVASGASGEAFAVWQQYKGGRIKILSAHYATTSWSDAGAVDLSTLSANPSAPIIVSRSSGEADAAWIQSDGTSPRAYAAIYSSGKWSTPVAVDKVAATEQVWTIALTTAASGEAFLIWSQGANKGAHTVVAARYSSGSWGTLQTLDSSTGISDDGNATTTEGTFPQIVSGASGSAFAVWLHVGSDSVRRIFASRFADGSWSTAQAVDPGVNSVATTPIVASPSNSQAFVSWAQNDGTVIRVWQNQFVAGNWQSPRKISSLDSTADVKSAPLVATVTAGQAFAIWEQSDGTSLRTWANFFSGEAWGPAATIDASPPDKGVAGSFVTSGGSSGAFAGWLESDGTSTKVYVTEFTSGS